MGKGAYWRHGPAGEHDGACALDDLLEVCRGVEVLVLELDIAVC